MKATNWKMIPEWCCTLYTKPKLTTTYIEDTSALKRGKTCTEALLLPFFSLHHHCSRESKSPAVSLPVCAAAPSAPPGPWGPAWPAGRRRSSVWWVMSAVAPGPADPPSVLWTCTMSVTGCNRGGEIVMFTSEYKYAAAAAAAGLIIFTEGSYMQWTLTLLVDSEKLQNFASTSRLVSFSL